MSVNEGTATGQDTWDVATVCRKALNRELYGGDAPNDSNALSEVWRTRTASDFGAAFTISHRGRIVAVMVMAVDEIDEHEPLLRPNWGGDT